MLANTTWVIIKIQNPKYGIPLDQKDSCNQVILYRAPARTLQSMIFQMKEDTYYQRINQRVKESLCWAEDNPLQSLNPEDLKPLDQELTDYNLILVITTTWWEQAREKEATWLKQEKQLLHHLSNDNEMNYFFIFTNFIYRH